MARRAVEWEYVCDVTGQEIYEDDFVELDPKNPDAVVDIVVADRMVALLYQKYRDTFNKIAKTVKDEYVKAAKE